MLELQTCSQILPSIISGKKKQYWASKIFPTHLWKIDCSIFFLKRRICWFNFYFNNLIFYCLVLFSFIFNFYSNYSLFDFTLTKVLLFWNQATLIIWETPPAFVTIKPVTLIDFREININNATFMQILLLSIFRQDFQTYFCCWNTIIKKIRLKYSFFFCQICNNTYPTVISILLTLLGCIQKPLVCVLTKWNWL